MAKWSARQCRGQEQVLQADCSVQILVVLPLNSCVTLDKFLNLICLLCEMVKNNNSTYFAKLLKGLNILILVDGKYKV